MHPKIPGLTYIDPYITLNEQSQLIDQIDQQIWLTELKRRVQHYGYKYDYKKRKADSSMYLGKLPDWIETIALRLYQEKLTAQMSDQVIINEYLPGQGIASHIDCIPCFGETVISLSLGSPCVMEFIQVGTGQKVPVLLLPGSLIILQGEARYHWQHRIPPRKRDRYENQEFVRTRRVSLTFRKVLNWSELAIFSAQASR